MSVNLEQVAHRPWPLPAGTWIMAQTWHDLLFAHWPVPEASLRPHIPERLAIDTSDGQAWLGVVPFRMSGVRLRGMPAVPWLSAFPELNVRTYVVANGKPGVWFFSLDAANRIAVAIARAWFHLPYFRAQMSCEERSGWIEYKCARSHRGAACGVLKRTLSSDWRDIFGGARLARTFSDGALLSLHDRCRGASHFRRNSSRTVAVASCGSSVGQQYDAGGRGNLFSAGKTIALFFEATGCSRLAAATIASLSHLWCSYHL